MCIRDRIMTDCMQVASNSTADLLQIALFQDKKKMSSDCLAITSLWNQALSKHAPWQTKLNTDGSRFAADNLIPRYKCHGANWLFYDVIGLIGYLTMSSDWLAILRCHRTDWLFYDVIGLIGYLQCHRTDWLFHPVWKYQAFTWHRKNVHHDRQFLS